MKLYSYVIEFSYVRSYCQDLNQYSHIPLKPIKFVTSSTVIIFHQTLSLCHCPVPLGIRLCYLANMANPRGLLNTALWGSWDIFKMKNDYLSWNKAERD